MGGSQLRGPTGTWLADYGPQSEVHRVWVPARRLSPPERQLSLGSPLNFTCCFPSAQSIDPGQQFTWENSNLEVNKPKNRYANVIAYDHSRVILTSIDGELRRELYPTSLLFLLWLGWHPTKDAKLSQGP